MTTPPEDDDPRYNHYWSAWMKTARIHILAGQCAVCVHPAPYGYTCGCRECIAFWSVSVPEFARVYLQEEVANELGERRARSRRWNWRAGLTELVTAGAAGIVGAVVTWPVLLWLAGGR